jgi:hypothetical protein
MYFCVYSRGRYITKLAKSIHDLVSDSFDFKVATSFESFEDADSYCRSMNIALRGNFEDLPSDKDDLEC